MSYSSLYGIKKDYTGERIADYKNSWLFSPIVWNVLSDKYLPKMFGMTQSLVSNRYAFSQVNNIMNDSDNLFERICWELSNQQIFFTKDKNIICESIIKFLKNNCEYSKDESDGIGILSREHIIERWNQIKDTIMELDEEEYPYFVWKGTSVDDNVERWFEKYDEEKDEYVECSLKDNKEFCAEFIVLNGEEIEFISNLEYKYKE